MLVISAFIFIFNGCSKDKKYLKRLEGKWSIAKVTFTDVRTKQSFYYTDNGYMNFYKDGAGSWEMNSFAPDMKKRSFTFEVKDNYITLLVDPNSYFNSIRFYIQQNESEFQKWDGLEDNGINKWILDLRK